VTDTIQHKQQVDFLTKLYAIRKLTRWRQHVPYTLPAVISGALLAVYLNELALNWRLLPVVIANILAMSFAFMINDVVDAPDDMRDPLKQKSNVISQGLLTVKEGNILSGIIFGVSAILFFFGGWYSFIIGMGTLILSYLYSAPPFRLKARPIVDIVSHVLMLSTFLMMSGYYIYDSNPQKAWFIIIAITFVSAYGQFYNQMDDFDVDKAVGIKNTAMFLGKRGTYIAILISVGGVAIFFSIGILQAVFPTWLGPMLLLTGFTLALFRWNHDIRGNKADASGMIQLPFLILINIMIFTWLLGELGLLTP
jgi:4-hydroxybenzoate polyprenyltransferase